MINSKEKSLMEELAYVPEELVSADDLGGLMTVQSNSLYEIQRYYIKPHELEYIFQRVVDNDK